MVLVNKFSNIGEEVIMNKYSMDRSSNQNGCSQNKYQNNSTVGAIQQSMALNDKLKMTRQSFQGQQQQQLQSQNYKEKVISSAKIMNGENNVNKQSFVSNVQKLNGGQDKCPISSNTPQQSEESDQGFCNGGNGGNGGYSKFNSTCQCHLKQMQQYYPNAQTSVQPNPSFQSKQLNQKGFMQKCEQQQSNVQQQQQMQFQSQNMCTNDFVDQDEQMDECMSPNQMQLNNKMEMTKKFENQPTNIPVYHTACQQNYNNTMPSLNSIQANSIVIPLTNSQQSISINEDKKFFHMHPDVMSYQQFNQKQLRNSSPPPMGEDMNDGMANVCGSSNDSCALVPRGSNNSAPHSLIIKPNPMQDSLIDNIIVKKVSQDSSKVSKQSNMSYFKKSSRDTFLPQTQLNININLSAPPCCTSTNGHCGTPGTKMVKQSSRPIEMKTNQDKSQPKPDLVSIQEKEQLVKKIDFDPSGKSLLKSNKHIYPCESCKEGMSKSTRPSSRSSEVNRRLSLSERREIYRSQENISADESNNKSNKPHCLCNRKCNQKLKSQQTQLKNERANKISFMEDIQPEQQGDVNLRQQFEPISNQHSNENIMQQQNYQQNDQMHIRSMTQQNNQNFISNVKHQLQHDQNYPQQDMTHENFTNGSCMAQSSCLHSDVDNCQDMQQTGSNFIQDDLACQQNEKSTQCKLNMQQFSMNFLPDSNQFIPCCSQQKNEMNRQNMINKNDQNSLQYQNCFNAAQELGPKRHPVVYNAECQQNDQIGERMYDSSKYNNNQNMLYQQSNTEPVSTKEYEQNRCINNQKLPYTVVTPLEIEQSAVENICGNRSHNCGNETNKPNQMVHMLQQHEALDRPERPLSKNDKRICKDTNPLQLIYSSRASIRESNDKQRPGSNMSKQGMRQNLQPQPVDNKNKPGTPSPKIQSQSTGQASKPPPCTPKMRSLPLKSNKIETKPQTPKTNRCGSSSKTTRPQNFSRQPQKLRANGSFNPGRAGVTFRSSKTGSPGMANPDGCLLL